MDLTPQEQKMVAKLRQWQRHWHWGKWAILIAGIAYLAVGCSICVDLHEDLKSTMGLLSLALDLPFLSFYFGGGLFLILYSAGNWHAFANDTLLLKLLDEHSTLKTSEGI